MLGEKTNKATFKNNQITFSETIDKDLSRLRAYSEQNKIHEVNKCVHFLLSNPKFWIVCYESNKNYFRFNFLESNSITDKGNILNENDLEFFNNLSMNISRGKFNFGSIMNINTSKLSKRSFGISDYRNEIVQKGIAIILQELSEHRFLDSNFGFRKGKSCHDAIKYIKKKVPSGMWAIEGDISKCFDRFNNKRIVSLICKKYVSHQIFIDLLYKALKTKIILINSSSINKLDTIKGCVVNRVLFSIYLHELDVFIDKSEILDKFRNTKSATINPKFKALLSVSKEENQKAENIKKSKGKLSYWKFLQELKLKKLKIAEKKNIPRVNFKGINRRIVYARYAHNFILFVWGTKNDCLELKKFVRNFLKGNLDLDFSEEKSRITFLKKEKANFLGFQIWQSPVKILTKNSDINFFTKISRVNMNSKFCGASLQKPRIQITFSFYEVLRKLVDKGLVRYKAGKFYPTSYKSLLQFKIGQIIFYIKSLFSCLVSYYGLAYNWYYAKILYNYFGLYCAAMTIAHKTKSKISNVFQKYGSRLTLKESTKVIVSFGVFSTPKLKKNVYNSSITFSQVTQILNKNFSPL